MSPRSSKNAAGVAVDTQQQQEGRVQHMQDSQGVDGVPAVGSCIQVKLPYDESSKPWDCIIHSATADGEHILLVDATCLSAAAAGIYRQVQLAPGTWRVQQGTASVAPELLPSSDALKQGLLLLNKTIRVWLGGARAKPTVAPVVAYSAESRQHVLRINGEGHSYDLQDYRWELVEVALAEPAPRRPLAAATAAAAAKARVPAQRKRASQQQQQQSGRPVRARVQQDPQFEEDDLSEAAGSSKAAPVAVSAQPDTRAMVDKAPAVPAKDSRATQDTHSAAPAPAPAPAQNTQPAIAAAAQHRGSAAQHTGTAQHTGLVVPAATSDAGCPAAGRPQRNRQPSSRLVLPGEQQSHVDLDAVTDQHQICITHGKPAAQPGQAAPQQHQQQLAGQPTDAQVLAAAVAAGVPHMPAGMGEVHWAGLGGKAGAVLQVELQGFMAGSPVSCHVSSQVSHAGDAVLYQRVPSSNSSSTHPVLRQLSQPCHDCRAQHIPCLCLQPGCNILASTCNRCLLQRYSSLYSLAQLLEACPACRKACACSSCLRSADHMQLVPPLQFGAQQLARQAGYVLREVVPLLTGLLQQQQAEAVAWGHSSLLDVPPSPLDVEVRPLCDRCATQIVGIAAHCPRCSWEVCCECTAALRQHAQAAAAGAAAGGVAAAAAGSGVQQGRSTCPQVTCCSPQCGMPAREGSVRALGAEDRRNSISSMTSAASDEGPSVVRQQLFSRPGAPLLHLQLVLPPDLLDSLAELLQLAQASPSNWAAPLQLQDCPLLLPSDLQLLHSSPPTVPSSSRNSCSASCELLTLQHLQSPDWWQYLPAELQDSWRRSAAVPGWHKPQQQQQQTQRQLRVGSKQGSASHPVAAAGATVAAAAAAAVGDVIQRSCAGGSSSGSDASVGFLFTPDVEQLQQQGPVGLLARLLFWARWRLGHPVVVRGVKGCIPWDPDTLKRAMGGEPGDAKLKVVDCEDFSQVVVTHDTFFTGYLQGHMVDRECDGHVAPHPVMYKLKDWPPSDDIREKLCRHYADFLAALPLRLYTEPRQAASQLNLATALIDRDNPTDLGPKCYIAYGRVAETQGEGDSVTKVHNDMTDAVNLLLHTAPGGDSAAQETTKQQQQQQGRCGDEDAQRPGYQGAGAVWDIWSRGALQHLNAYLDSHADSFIHRGQPVLEGDDALVTQYPVLSQAFMLTQAHRDAFLASAQQQQQQHAQQHGVVPPRGQAQQQQQQQQQQEVSMWHFEQFEGEAVFIPSGCAHQVRNLKSCCKIAADFVSPESMAEALAHKARLRGADLSTPQPLDEPPGDRACQEKLQSQLILLRAALRASRTLRAVQQQGGQAAAC